MIYPICYRLTEKKGAFEPIIELILFVIRHGTNTRHVREVQSLCELIANVFDDFILKVLCVAAVVAMVVGIYNDGWSLGWIDGVSIIVAIFIIVIVTVANDMAKEAKF